ncbi:MAG: glycosyltransferase [Akkermansia sp.]
MKFYIVTPTFNNWSWLEACIKSVADQGTETLHVHHHVQDGGSNDGTAERLAEWLEKSKDIPHYTFSYVSGKDAGMYDAINLAWAQMPDDADFTAHLNSDEQYLPGALAEIAPYFEQYQQADVLLGSYIILDAKLGYIAHRRPVKPRLWSSWLNCTCITNSSFYRVSSFHQHQMAYDSRWKISGDLVFYRHLLQVGVNMQTIPVISSTFVCTGANLAWSPRAKDEWNVLVEESPFIYRLLGARAGKWVNLTRRIKDCFLPAPRQYALFEAGADSRSCITILKPTCRWNLRTEADPTAYQR